MRVKISHNIFLIESGFKTELAYLAGDFLGRLSRSKDCNFGKADLDIRDHQAPDKSRTVQSRSRTYRDNGRFDVNSVDADVLSVLNG